MNNSEHTGTVVQIIGGVVDVEFPDSDLPRFIPPSKFNGTPPVTMAKQKSWRKCNSILARKLCVAFCLSSSDGLRRGNKVINTNMPISVPVGRQNLGRLFNVLGETIDGLMVW